KTAGLLMGGALAGGFVASCVWCVALIAVVVSHESDDWENGAFYGPGVSADGSYLDEMNTDALMAALNADPVVQRYLGEVTAVTMNEPLSYGDDVDYDEWYYDVTGVEGTAVVRARFDRQDRYKEAEIRFPDGTIEPLNLVAQPDALEAVQVIDPFFSGAEPTAATNDGPADDEPAEGSIEQMIEEAGDGLPAVGDDATAEVPADGEETGRAPVDGEETAATDETAVTADADDA
ncbi:MAG: hypothetical protein AAF907_07365, partial [Planctomycetota bacterium]